MAGGAAPLLQMPSPPFAILNKEAGNSVGSPSLLRHLHANEFFAKTRLLAGCGVFRRVRVDGNPDRPNWSLPQCALVAPNVVPGPDIGAIEPANHSPAFQ